MPNFIRRLAGEKFWEDTGRQLLNHEICQGLSFSKSATFWVLLTLQKSHAIGHWHIVRKRTFTTRDERKPWRSKASNWRKEVPMISTKYDEIIPKNEKNKSGISKIRPCLYFESFQHFVTFGSFFGFPDQLETLSASRKSERTCGADLALHDPHNLESSQYMSLCSISMAVGKPKNSLHKLCIWWYLRDLT